MSHEDLLAEYYAGDDAAFSELYRQSWSPLVRYLMSIGAEPRQVEDLVQETMYRVARTRLKDTRFDRGQGTYLGWTFRTARNVFLDHVRHHRRHIRETKSLDEDEPEGVRPLDPAVPATQELAVAQRQESRELWMLLRKIPEEQRMAVILHDFEGLSYDEVGRIQGVPGATAASRRKLGLEKLRALLRPGEEEKGAP